MRRPVDAVVPLPLRTSLNMLASWAGSRKPNDHRKLNNRWINTHRKLKTSRPTPESKPLATLLV
jgi:hypothetical protein